MGLYSGQDHATSAAGGQPANTGGKPAMLLEVTRERIRRLGLAKRTEQAYVGWIRRFVLATFIAALF